MRLRLDDTCSHPLVEKLPDDHDKLASADKFRHQVVYNFDHPDELTKIIMDSYQYNNP